MTTRSRPISLPPAAALALAVLLCGGALAEPTTAALLLQRAEEASTSAASESLRAAQRTAHRDQRKAVANLLNCLADAVRQFHQLHDGADAVAAPDWQRLLPPLAQTPLTAGASEHAVHPALIVLPQHLNLPPPVSTL